jgi:HEAT repeat protein
VVGEKVTRTLDSLAYEPGDREVRKQAIATLSRRPADEAIPALLKMVETLPDRELRKTAVFWLAQSKDPRAMRWMEQQLSR